MRDAHASSASKGDAWLERSRSASPRQSQLRGRRSRRRGAAGAGPRPHGRHEARRAHDEAGHPHVDADDDRVVHGADRAGHTGTAPLWWNDAACRPNRQLVAGGSPATTPIFWALPASTPSPPATTTPLSSIETSLAGYTQVATVAYVWMSPMRVPLPVQDFLPALVADGGSDECQTESNPGAGAYASPSASASTHSGGHDLHLRLDVARRQRQWGDAVGASPSASPR